MNYPKTLSAVAIGATLLFTTSCETVGPNEGAGTAIGAATGALAGAIIGNNVSGGNSVGGALIGAAVGGGVGNVIGRQSDTINEQRRYQGGGGYDYPVAQRTGTNGYVYSPYPPNHMIDVRGIPSGAVVIDPSCNKRFINP